MVARSSPSENNGGCSDFLNRLSNPFTFTKQYVENPFSFNAINELSVANTWLEPPCLTKLVAGIDLDDGKAIFDKAEFVSEDDAKEVGVELHIGSLSNGSW